MHTLAWIIGPLTFGAPVLLWGALGAAAPILIHLMLRPRPRRQPFPAIRFVLQTHAAAEKTNRLKRLLLLVMRMAVIAWIAMLLAQPRVRAARWVPVGGGPISVAFCIDDSASMAYRYEGKTRVDAAKEWAETLVNDRTRFGDESEFVVLTSGLGATDAKPAEQSLNPSRAATTARIESIAPGSHDYPVGRMIRRADELLAKARHPRREIYVFTDSTVRAWRDVTGPPLGMASAATVYCVDVGVDEDRNTSITLTSTAQHALPANAPIRLDLAVHAGRSCHGPVRPTLEVRVDDQPRVRCTVPTSTDAARAGELAAGQTLNVPVVVPGLPEGLHRITIEMSPSDPLLWDNMRYACVQVGELPRTGIISDEEAADSAGTLVSAMLAPPTLPDDRQRVHLTRLTPAEAETTSLAAFRCVFLVDVPCLDERLCHNLTEYARGGGVVVTVLGGRVIAGSYGPAADLLPGLPETIEQFQPPTHLAPTDLTNPLLEPFANPGVDSLSDRAILRAWRIRQMANQAAVLCPLASGGPGLLERPVGTGRSLLLTFSPQREWSEFAAQAAPMILLLHTIIATGSPTTDRVAYATAGGAKTVTIPSSVGAAVNVRTSAIKLEGEPRRVNAAAAEWHVAIPTGQCGHVTIEPVERPGGPLFLCAVNVADEESDLRRLAAHEVVGRFAPSVATTAQTSSELGQMQRHKRVGVDGTIPAGVAILVLLFAESAFANRFYKRSPSPRVAR
jgi:hypothetical protein